MKFKTRVELKVAKLMKIDLASETLDNFTIYFLEGDELVEGLEVFSMNEDGEYIAFPDGSYSWGEKTVVIENSIVQSINEKTETGEAEMKKMEKLEAEVVTVEDFNQLIEVVNEIIEEVDKQGGDVEPIATTEELKAVKEKLSKMEPEFEKLKADLKLAKETSNGNFVDPNTNKGGSNGNSFDPKAELAKFNIR